jgi:glutamate-1-semialdehyde 2,1-aminomutase
VLEREQVHKKIFRLGRRLMAGLAAAAQETGLPLVIQGPGPMFQAAFAALPQARNYRDTLTYDRARYGRFVQEMQERGIRLIGRGLWYLSAAHSEAEIDQAIDTARGVLRQLE